MGLHLFRKVAFARALDADKQREELVGGHQLAPGRLQLLFRLHLAEETQL